MRQTYTYKRPKDNWFWLTAGTLNILFTLYILLKTLQADKYHWTVFLLPITYGLLGAAFFRVYFIRRQYHQIDKSKEITVDTSKGEIIISQLGRETTINKRSIKEVEIYSSWNTTPLFGKLGYVKFNLLNGDNIKVTRFTADYIDLQPLITGKPVKLKTRLMNPIK